MQNPLMDKMGIAEGALRELTNELQLSVSEEVRSTISALEMDLVDENEKFASLIARVERHREMQQKIERKIDLQYRRTMFHLYCFYGNVYVYKVAKFCSICLCKYFNSAAFICTRKRLSKKNTSF